MIFTHAPRRSTKKQRRRVRRGPRARDTRIFVIFIPFGPQGSLVPGGAVVSFLSPRPPASASRAGPLRPGRRRAGRRRATLPIPATSPGRRQLQPGARTFQLRRSSSTALRQRAGGPPGRSAGSVQGLHDGATVSGALPHLSRLKRPLIWRQIFLHGEALGPVPPRSAAAREPLRGWPGRGALSCEGDGQRRAGV